MHDILGDSLRKLNWLHVRRTRMNAMLLILSFVVSLNVFWAMRQPGLTLAGDATCGILEHTHDEDCGTQICVCTLSEEVHVHSDACYEMQFVPAQEELRLMCSKAEDPHAHNESCYTTILTDPIQETVLNCNNEAEDHIHEDGCYTLTEIPGQEESVLDCTLTVEPHEHTDNCYAMQVVEFKEAEALICGLTETVHTHEESCYEWDLKCGYEEHVHNIMCYSDKMADVETPLDWQNMFADYPYTGNLRQDLVGIARTQVGYSESEWNFEVDSNGVRQGYTRYGAWYGTPYRDWSAMFVSFCLNYAGADSREVPTNTGANAMAEQWKKLEKCAPVGTYDPVAGDLVFFDNNTVGIVAEVQNATFCVIRGDMEDAVRSDVLPLTDGSVVGWGCTEGTIPVPEESAEETEPTEPGETVSNVDLLDISNGPVFAIFVDGEAAPQMQTYSLRSMRTITDLLSYLEEKGGSYFFTLLDQNNQELKKDENGNYIAQANTGYKITISFNSPEGFLPGTYQYQVPNGLMVDGGEGTFILNDGTNVGSWTVTDTGLITLTFNENINTHADITISSTLGIHFPEQDDPIDFDGQITVTVQKPPQQQFPTELYKWGIQGGAQGAENVDSRKFYWTVNVIGHQDSQIPGNILSDNVIFGEWSKTHRYTESDIAGGLRFGVSENGNWHSWHVSADDPHLVWTETGWSYKIPKTVTCDTCGELELGNEGWIYYINYTSTPDPPGTAGTFGYENMATLDGQNAYAWTDFTHGEVQGEIAKRGSFVSDAGGGAFRWEIQAVVPGRQEGNLADYRWYIMDYLYLIDEGSNIAGHVENDAHLATITATYKGTTIQIPNVKDATDADLFAWHNEWSSTNEDGVSYGREITLLSRCICDEKNCQWGEGCDEHWFQKDDGTWAQNGFCTCWTDTEDMVFTLVYETDDIAMIEHYGGFGYQLRNVVELHYQPPGSNDNVLVDGADATVPIPGVFKKELTQDFDGYTAHYNVTVNEAKLVLTNGSPLVIHDAMSETLAYISGSLVITAEDANGNRTQLQQGTDFTVTYDGTGNQTDAQGKEVHVLDIVIQHPQPVMYILDYDATLVLPNHVTSGIKYTNSATISLWGEDITDDSAEKVYADINIATKSYKVDMYKTCALTGEPLGGATFGLFNERGGLISTEVSDSNGALRFQTNIIEGIVLREHIPYYLQELAPPPGYQLDDTKFWFCFCDHLGDSCATCDAVLAGLDAIRIPFEQIGKVHVTNERISYDLPSTGGTGETPWILAGVIFIVTPLVYEFIRRRKQERRGVG